MTTTYEQFLETKIRLAARAGLEDVSPAELPDGLLPHARDVALWALRQGRALIAASFGLTKTRIQCAIAQVLHQRTGQPFLVVAPLGVRHQFTHEDGPIMEQTWQYVRTDAEIEAATTPFLITNYERVRDGDIDPRRHDLCGASLDEGAVLRNMDSKTSDVFCEVFADVPFRFVATATPAPNRYREIIYYARFLGVVSDTGLILTKFFKRNPDKAGDLQIHPHLEAEFWLFVASWSLFLYRPSDLCQCDCHRRGGSNV